MKKNLLLSLICFWWIAGMAQTVKVPSIQDALNKLPQSPASWWTLDSTWYSQWDPGTTSWDKNEREIFTYNNSGAIVQDLYLDLNTVTQTWDNWTRYTYNYIYQGGIQSQAVQEWDTFNHIWKNISYYHYNDQGLIDTSLSLSYDRLQNVYDNGGRTITSYNASHQYVEFDNQILDTASSDWINQSKSLYTYDGSNRLSELVYQNWNTSLSTWINSSKYDYTFDPTGFASGFTEYSWNAGGNNWVNQELATYLNNSVGNPNQKLYQFWNAGTSAWVNQELDMYQYNSGNQMVQDIDFTWSPTLLSWLNNTKDTFSFYSGGIPYEHYQYTWNPLGLVYLDTYYNKNDSTGYLTYQYIFGYQYLYTYTATHKPLVTMNQLLKIPQLTWFDNSRRTDTYDGNQNCITEIDQQYDTISAAWTNTFRQDHFYSFTTGIHEHHTVSDYCFFANPMQAGQPIVCSNLVAGKNYQVFLMNMQGQLIQSTNLHAGESLTVPQNLSAGMYMMQIVEGGKNVATGKVIIH
jgi:hypothetical protein